MGRSRGVQVVNFIGQGSIEKGMLSALAFEKSLFAGVLDGGESEVFLQRTRLSKFMASVEQVAGAMGEADADSVTELRPDASAGAPVDPAPLQPVTTEPERTAGDAQTPLPNASPAAEPPDP